MRYMPEVGVSTHSAMEGGGFYNRHSALQQAAIFQVLPLWRSIVETATPRDGGFVLVDYAASQGKNSLPPINLALDVLLQKAPASIEVIHTDLPSNDFSSLFTMLEHDPDSYLRRDTRISALAIGRSYFQPVVSPGKVDLAWNSWSLQWMSRLPQPIPDGVFIDCSTDAETRQAFDRQLRADWEQFLTCRSMELTSGGALLSMFVANRQDLPGWGPFWGAFWSVLVEMKNAGKLSDAQLDAISMPIGTRTVEDIKAPFADDGRFANLWIEHLDMIEGPDPFWDAYLATRDSRQFGWSWTNMARAVIGPLISDALVEEKDKDGLLNEIFDRFALKMAADPQRVAHCLAVVVLRKL